MFSDEEWSSLLDTVLARTEADALTWEAGGSPCTYGVDLAKSTLLLRSVDEDDNAPFEISIYRQLDDHPEDDEFIGRLDSNGLPNGAAGERLSNLYRLVKRQVAGTSTVFKELMDALGGPVEKKQEARKASGGGWGQPKGDPWGQPKNENEPPF